MTGSDCPDTATDMTMAVHAATVATRALSRVVPGRIPLVMYGEGARLRPVCDRRSCGGSAGFVPILGGSFHTAGTGARKQAGQVGARPACQLLDVLTADFSEWKVTRARVRRVDAVVRVDVGVGVSVLDEREQRRQRLIRQGTDEVCRRDCSG